MKTVKNGTKNNGECNPVRAFNIQANIFSR